MQNNAALKCRAWAYHMFFTCLIIWCQLRTGMLEMWNLMVHLKSLERFQAGFRRIFIGISVSLCRKTTECAMQLWNHTAATFWKENLRSLLCVTIGCTCVYLVYTGAMSGHAYPFVRKRGKYVASKSFFHGVIWHEFMRWLIDFLWRKD